MSIHKLHCQEPWCRLLEEGTKSVEGRLNDEECASIKPGDQINVYNDDRNFSLTVMRVQHFTTLANYLETVGLQRALPGVNSIKDGCSVYLQFYTEAQIQKYGVLAFWVQRANKPI